MHLTKHYIVAEYCGGPFYEGWHLYERDTNDGRLNADGESGWMRSPTDQTEQKRVYGLCCSMGLSPPKCRSYHSDVEKWFATTFPNGLRVTKDEWGGYELLEIVGKRPRQQPHVVRTIRGAAACDRRQARLDAIEREKKETGHKTRCVKENARGRTQTNSPVLKGENE